jgi:hypothetical protein
VAAAGGGEAGTVGRAIAGSAPEVAGTTGVEVAEGEAASGAEPFASATARATIAGGNSGFRTGAAAGCGAGVDRA